MATASEVINRALRLIGAVAAGEEPSAQESADALTALNAMLADWERRGASLGFSEAVNASDELDIPAHAVKAVTYSLAVEIAPEYETNPSPLVVNEADQGYRRILRDAIGLPRSSVTHLPSARGWYDINSE